MFGSVILLADQILSIKGRIQSFVGKAFKEEDVKVSESEGEKKLNKTLVGQAFSEDSVDASEQDIKIEVDVKNQKYSYTGQGGAVVISLLPIGASSVIFAWQNNTIASVALACIALCVVFLKR